jgi:hypothetical protein
MAPTSSKKQSSVSVSPVVLDPPVSASAPAASADTLAKKKKPVVTPTVLATTPVVAPVTITVPATPIAPETGVVAVPVDATAPADNALSNIIDKVNSLSAAIKDIQTNLKVLSKEYDKQQKIIEKAQKKRQNAKNSPSGFAKPNKISDELCDFIGVPHGTEKSRTDITRLINAYVKEHNLNKPENKRFILPDDKLKKILNVGDSEEINYFILQKLISHHFPASASKTAAKLATVTA